MSDTRAQFMEMMVAELQGQPVKESTPAKVEEAKHETDARADFVQLAMGDMGVKVPDKQTAQELAEAFHPVSGPSEDSSSVELIEKFKSVAEDESKDILSKLLKGIK